ncbi:MAG: GAF domain-containing protein, partial [Candidatus Rokuibacteriota bacterium]
LPPMTEPTKLAAMRILTRIAPAASLSNVHLYEMTVCKLVELTAAYGHCPESALAYVLMGGLRCRILGDSDGGYRAGMAGLTLIDRLGATGIKSRAHMTFNITIQPWRIHPRELLAPLAEARRLGLESGDFRSASTSAFCRCLMGLWGGQNLLELKRAARDFHQEATALGQRPLTVMFESLEAVLEELAGKSWASSVLEMESARDGDGEPPPSRVRHNNVYYAVTSCELWGHLVFRRHDRARSTLDATTDRVGTAPALVPWEFMCGLAILGGDELRPGEGQGRLWPVVEGLQEQLERRARAAPHAYRHRAALVAAERARTTGRTQEAMMQYLQAIDGAHTNGFLLEEALATEMAAEFCLACGYRHLTGMYLHAAATAYGRWGARAKVGQLRDKYREFFGADQPAASILQPSGIEGGGAAVSGALELASIERAAGALAQQLDLAELLHRLLSILLHYTGAQRGALLRVAADGLFLEASASVDRAERPLVVNRPLETSDDVPRTVVRFVSRSAESLVVGDMAQDERFSRDPYLAHARPRSLLCVPVQHRGVLGAIIYLEHRQLPNIFGEERIAAVQLIASQAAGALENARLHADLKAEVANRQRVEEALRQALHETASLKERLQAENLYLREEIKGTHDFNEIIGESDTWRRVLFKVEQVAATDASVLLLGETGTGKE